MTAARKHDVVIVGGGIAGVSAAYYLARCGVSDIVILERESAFAMHATGRSAAVTVAYDPSPLVVRLKAEGARFLRAPPLGFAEHPLLEPCGILMILREPERSAVLRSLPVLEANAVSHAQLSAADAVGRVPALLHHRIESALWFERDGHIDVHELLSGYLRGCPPAQVQRTTGTEVLGIRVERGRCVGVETATGFLAAEWVVNAAGAWAGWGAASGAMPIPLKAYRRTIVTYDAPAGLEVRDWPLVDAESDHVYFKPESGGLLFSPADEDAAEPCDVHPDDMVIAEAFERLRGIAPSLIPHALRRRWAGLRTFAGDRLPVVGEDARVSGFFWLAGQGGFGIETSPVLGRIAADLLVSGRSDWADVSALSPRRFLGVT